MSRKMALLPSSDSTSWGKGPYVTHLRLSAVTDGAGSLWTRGWGRRKAGISEFIKKQNQLYKYIIYKNQKAWTSTQSKSAILKSFYFEAPLCSSNLRTDYTKRGKQNWGSLNEMNYAKINVMGIIWLYGFHRILPLRETGQRNISG